MLDEVDQVFHSKTELLTQTDGAHLLNFFFIKFIIIGSIIISAQFFIT